MANITSQATLFVADTERIVPRFAIANTDTSRTVLAPISVSIDTLRRMTTHLQGTKSVSVTLAAKTLSDSFDIQTYQAVELGQVITGTIKGFAYTFIADEASYDERSKLYTVRGTYDIGNKLNEYITANPNGTTASSIMASLCSSLGKSLSFQADNFAPSDVVQEGNEFTDTYSGIIGKLFGWTDRVPTMLINVFERGNQIIVLQRGKETGTVTLTEAECSYPVISRKKINLLQGGGSNSIYGSEVAVTSNNWINGTFGGSTFSNGLLINEHFETGGEFVLGGGMGATTQKTVTDTTYYYSASYPPAKLLSSTALSKVYYPYADLAGGSATGVATGEVNVSSSSTTKTTNYYSGGDLVESVETTESEDEVYVIEDGALKDIRYDSSKSQTVTKHTNAGQGMWVTATYRDGKLIGTQVSTGNPGGDASVYSIQRDSMTSSSIRAYASINGRLNGDNTFPIYDEATIGRIAAAINALNGKTEERIRLTCFGASLVDFSSLVSFRGNSYYLESNAISQDARNFSQQLELVRWY